MTKVMGQAILCSLLLVGAAMANRDPKFYQDQNCQEGFVGHCFCSSDNVLNEFGSRLCDVTHDTSVRIGFDRNEDDCSKYCQNQCGPTAGYYFQCYSRYHRMELACGGNQTICQCHESCDYRGGIPSPMPFLPEQCKAFCARPDVCGAVAADGGDDLTHFACSDHVSGAFRGMMILDNQVLAGAAALAGIAAVFLF